MDATAFVTDLLESRYEYRTVCGTVEKVETVDGETDRSTVEVWEVPPDRSRVDGEDGVVVANGETVVVRDETGSEQTRHTTERSDQFARPELLVAVVRGDRDPELGVTETIAGRRARELIFSPSGGPIVDGVERATVWVDDERRFPLRFRIEHHGDTTRTTRREWQTVTFDAEIPDERFHVDSPDSAGDVS